jgi:hypothetical protein
MPDAGKAGAAVSSSRRRPPRRPRRRGGRAAPTASHSASTVETPARTALSFPQSSGLRRRIRSTSWSRSSGLRERRMIRWSTSPYRDRSRAASETPSTRPRIDSSGTLTGGRGGGGGGVGVCVGVCVGRAGFSSRPCGRAEGAGLAVAASFTSECQSNERSGCVCSSPALASSSSARRPTVTWAGDRKKYSTRASPLACDER